MPTGANTITHTYSDASTVTYLHNATELAGDFSGNDNGLCESFEQCLYTPNIGAYQGHEIDPAANCTVGTTEIQGVTYCNVTFSAGPTITNVTLVQFDTNGY